MSGFSITGISRQKPPLAFKRLSSGVLIAAGENKGNRGSYMTKQLEGERVGRVPQQIGQDAPPPAASPKKSPSVRMKIASVQYSGAIATPKGDVPSWRITFLLDAEHLLATSLTVQATGANDVIEARESGLNILRQFAQELLDAAIVFHA
jgi:hypothetical protein